MRALVINEGRVANIIVVDSLDVVLPGLTLAPALGGEAIGDVYDPETGETSTPPVALEDRKTAMMQAVRDLRWQRETAGIEVAGATIRTDEKSQAKLTGALQLFGLNPEMAAVDWEAQPGLFVALPKAQIEAVGRAVGGYIQACFTRSKNLTLEIAAAPDHAALDAIDLAADWPAQVVGLA